MPEKTKQLLLTISLTLISPLLIFLTFLLFRFKLELNFLPIDFGLSNGSFLKYFSDILIISLVEFGILSILILKNEFIIKENYYKTFIYFIYINTITYFIKTLIFKLFLNSFNDLNINLFIVGGFILTTFLELFCIKFFFKKTYKESLYLSFLTNFFSSYLVLIVILRAAF